MAGTRTTPPPMPRRPTSTPTPSPRKRMVNIMVTGRFRAHGLDDADQALLSCSLRRPAATSLEQAATIENARLFLFARNLLYLLVFLTSALWLAGGCAAARNAVAPKTLIPSSR